MTTSAGVLGLGREHASKTVKMHYCFEKLLQNKTKWFIEMMIKNRLPKTVNIMSPGVGGFGKGRFNIVHKIGNRLFRK